MHTTQQIIENQSKFKDDIVRFFSEEIKETKKELRETYVLLMSLF